MSLILQAINYDINEVDACTTLAALQAIADISPFTVADARSQLETGQPQAFSTAAFDAYLTKMYNLPLVDASLTAAEKTVLNVIREYLDPPAYLAYCATGDPETAGVTFELIHKVGSTADYEARVQFTTPYDCAIVKVVATETSAKQPLKVFVYQKRIKDNWFSDDEHVWGLVDWTYCGHTAFCGRSDMCTDKSTQFRCS